MSLLQPPPYIREEKAWYFLSIFYSRNAWAELLPHVMQFYNERQTQFCNCLISFSDNRGEHIQVALISPDCEKNYQTEIENFFRSFLEKNPTVSTKVFPYGKKLWCDYPNNSLAWNTFKCINYTELLINFHQKTMQLALQLLDDDFSNDNIFTLVLYLTTKGLTYFDPNMQNSTASDALNKIMSDFRDYASVELALQSIIEQIDQQHMCEAIQSYVEEDSSEYSVELIEWLVAVENMQEKEFKYFYDMTCYMTGLSGAYLILVLNLIAIWQKTSPTTAN